MLGANCRGSFARKPAQGCASSVGVSLNLRHAWRFLHAISIGTHMTHTSIRTVAVVRSLPAIPGVQPARVLVFTSDAPLAALLDDVLRRHGYDVQVLAVVDLASLNAFLPRVVVVDTSRLSERDLSALRAVDR